MSALSDAENLLLILRDSHVTIKKDFTHHYIPIMMYVEELIKFYDREREKLDSESNINIFMMLVAGDSQRRALKGLRKLEREVAELFRKEDSLAW